MRSRRAGREMRSHTDVRPPGSGNGHRQPERRLPVQWAEGGFQGGGSVDEAWMTGATPGDSITLLRNGASVERSGNPGTADSLGTLILRDLTPGNGYSWDDTTSGERSASFSVLSPGANPPTDSALYTDSAHARGPQLHHHARRDHTGRNRPVPLWPCLQHRGALSDRDRVLRLRRRPGRPTRSHPSWPTRRAPRARRAGTRTSSPTPPQTSARWWLVSPASPR